MGEMKPIQAASIPQSAGMGDGDTLLGLRSDGGKLRWYRFAYIAWSRITGAPSSLPASDVSAWAKAAAKPAYTPAEVGAAAANHTHTKGSITDFPSALPASDVSAWAKAAAKPAYTPAEVGAAAANHTHTKGSITDFPPALPNPHPLTLRGAAAAAYDGSAPVAVDIPIPHVHQPTGVALTYPALVSIRNAVLQRIEAQLLPAFTTQGCVLFLPAGGEAIELYPDGTFRVKQLGASRVYVVPTLAASAYKAVDITVRPAYLRRTGSGGLRLANGKARIF